MIRYTLRSTSISNSMSSKFQSIAAHILPNLKAPYIYTSCSPSHSIQHVLLYIIFRAHEIALDYLNGYITEHHAVRIMRSSDKKHSWPAEIRSKSCDSRFSFINFHKINSPRNTPPSFGQVNIAFKPHYYAVLYSIMMKGEILSYWKSILNASLNS